MAAYAAARPITVAGVSYTVGQTVPGSDTWPNVERWLRLRFLKPQTAPAGYRAVRPVRVGATVYAAGQTVPDAASWPNLHRWVQFRVVEPLP